MKNLVRLLTFVLLTATIGLTQSQINSFQILRLGKQSTAPANPPINASYVYFDGTNVVCVTSSGASCLASSGGSGTVTSIATTSPIGGGTITGTGTLTCTTCVVASSPGSGVAHFAGSTQTVTSSLIVAADITSATITGTQIASSVALAGSPTTTTQAAGDSSTKIATTAFVAAASGPYTTIVNADGSSDVLSSAGNFATTATLISGSANKGSTYDVWAVGSEHVTSGCSIVYGLVLDAVTIYGDVGHSTATGDFFWSGHWRFEVANTGASGTIIDEYGAGGSAVNQSNGGGSNPFGYTGSVATFSFDSTASHTVKVHSGISGCSAGGTTTLTHLTVTRLN